MLLQRASCQKIPFLEAPLARASLPRSAAVNHEDRSKFGVAGCVLGGGFAGNGGNEVREGEVITEPENNLMYMCVMCLVMYFYLACTLMFLSDR